MPNSSENSRNEKNECADGRKAWVAPTLRVYDVAELTEANFLFGRGADYGFYS